MRIRIKKGFTLIEILVVIVMISIISGLAILAVYNYKNKGKEEYNKSLENQFFLAGKNFFADNRDRLPTYYGEGKVVSLGELVTSNYLTKPLVDAENVECSSDSRVLVEKANNGKYEYTVCLLCDSFENNDIVACDPKEAIICNTEREETEDGEPLIHYHDKYGSEVSEEQYFRSCPQKVKKCQILNDGSMYYNSSGGKISDKAAYVESCSCKIVDGTYHDSDGYPVNEDEYHDSCDAKTSPIPDPTPVCEPITPFANINKTEYYYRINSTAAYTTSSSVITYLNGTTNSTLNLTTPGQTLYGHYILKAAYNSLKSNMDAVNSKPTTYAGTGSANANDVYYNSTKRKNAKKVTASDAPYTIKKDTQIPSEYSFEFAAKASSATISGLTSSTKMSGTDINKWLAVEGKSAANYDDIKGKVALAKSGVVDKYKAYYKNVGTYNGISVDVRMTLVGYGTCNAQKTCGLYFGPKVPHIHSFGLRKLVVKFEFLNSTTGKAITVKGYTTFWDIDAQQGVHFITGTTKPGLYTTGSSGLKVMKVNSAPYVFTTDKDDHYNYDDAAAITQTFYGSSMKLAFTYNVNGGIGPSDIPIGSKINYNSTSYTSNTVLTKLSSVPYKINFSNNRDTAKSLSIKVNLSGMEYVNGTAKLVYAGKTLSPTVSYNASVLTVSSSSIAKANVGYLTFNAKGKSCGNLAQASANVTVGSSTYKTNALSNVVMCPEKYTCN